MSLSNYIIGENLGSGSYGKVCIVTRKSGKEIFAMKRVKLSKLSIKEKEHALNEIRILYSLNNKNIIGYEEAFYDDESETLNIIMEYADDGDLESKIKELKKNKLFFDENTIWNILIQILFGLKYLHDNKIIHRDLKSANIFLTKNGIVKIGDLNVSKVLNNNKMAETKTGTPYYSAPEIWEDKLYDNKIDIWSVGCIIYEMCSLVCPFRATAISKLAKLIKKGEYIPIPDIYSDNLSNIISKMIIVNPLKRFNCDKLLKIPSVVEKIKNNQLINVEKGKKVILISTIKLPMRIANINNLLPQKKDKYEEEMLMNDLFESQKLSSSLSLVDEEKNNNIKNVKDDIKKIEDNKKTNNHDLFANIPVFDFVENKIEFKPKKKIVIQKYNNNSKKKSKPVKPKIRIKK